MRAEVSGLLERDGRVVGLEAFTPGGPLRVHADLVVAADGRDSIVRDRAGLPVQRFGAPMDVLWFRLPRGPGDPSTPTGFRCSRQGEVGGADPTRPTRSLPDPGPSPASIAR